MTFVSNDYGAWALAIGLLALTGYITYRLIRSELGQTDRLLKLWNYLGNYAPILGFATGIQLQGEVLPIYVPDIHLGAFAATSLGPISGLTTISLAWWLIHPQISRHIFHLVKGPHWYSRWEYPH